MRDAPICAAGFRGLGVSLSKGQIKAGIEVEKPIATMVLLAKAKLGRVLPEGEIGAGRGNKIPQQVGDFNKNTVTAYRKLGKRTDDEMNALA